MDATSYVFPWAVRHAAWCFNRYHKDEQSTPYVNGRAHDGELWIFGETVHYLPVGSTKTEKYKPRWKRGVWCGKSELGDQRLVMAETGMSSRATSAACRWSRLGTLRSWARCVACLGSFAQELGEAMHFLCHSLGPRLQLQDRFDRRHRQHSWCPLRRRLLQEQRQHRRRRCGRSPRSQILKGSSDGLQQKARLAQHR